MAKKETKKQKADRIGNEIMAAWKPRLDANAKQWHKTKEGWFGMLLFCPEVQKAIEVFSAGRTDVVPVVKELNKALKVAKRDLKKLHERFCK